MTQPSSGAPAPGTPTKLCPLCGGAYGDDLRFCPVDGQPLRDAAASDPLIGTFVAKRYLVERKLGEGGMGAVYEALQVTMDRRVALKVLHLSRLESDRDAMLRFSREASNASKIVHLNVASVFDFSVSPEEGIAYLAMELVEGESLGALLAREGALEARRAAAIAYQIADALAAAHELGLVHRDLKPDNVMLTRRPDGSDLVKVVDFGISRVMGSDTQRVTSTGLAIGTPAYMSPEQLEAGAIDARTDVFALGLICYRMLAGDLPWAADEGDRLFTKRLVQPRRPLTEVRATVAWPEDLQRVLDGAIAIEAAERYDSALAMALDLVTVIQRWIPDDPNAPAPWNRRLRLAMPAGMTRIFEAGRTTPGSAPAVVTGVPTGVRAGAPSGAPTGAAAAAPSAAPIAAPGTMPSGGASVGATAEGGLGASPSAGGRSRMPLYLGTGVAVVAAIAFALTRLGGNTAAPASPAAPASATGDSTREGTGTPPDTRPAGTPPASSSGATQGGTAVVAAPPAAANQAPGRGAPGGDPAASRTTTPASSEAKPEPAPSAPASARLSREAIRDAVTQMNALVRPSSSAGDARAALRLMERVMPGLDDPRDVVEVTLRGAEAHLLLDQPAQACRLLLSIERAAAATARRATVSGYLEDPELNCRNR